MRKHFSYNFLPTDEICQSQAATHTERSTLKAHVRLRRAERARPRNPRNAIFPERARAYLRVYTLTLGLRATTFYRVLGEVGEIEGFFTGPAAEVFFLRESTWRSGRAR